MKCLLKLQFETHDRRTFMLGLEISQGDNGVPGGHTLHHIVAAVLATAYQRHGPHLHGILTKTNYPIYYITYKIIRALITAKLLCILIITPRTFTKNIFLLTLI